MQDNGGEWMYWKRNPPAAISMVGMRKKQMRIARKILKILLKTSGASLRGESL